MKCPQYLTEGIVLLLPMQRIVAGAVEHFLQRSRRSRFHIVLLRFAPDLVQSYNCSSNLIAVLRVYLIDSRRLLDRHFVLLSLRTNQ